MKFFLIYLKQKRGILLVELFFFLIFLASFFLYHLPLKAVLYPILICSLFAVFFLIRDYKKVEKRHQKLNRLQKYSGIPIGELPETISIIEADYQELVRQLKKEEDELQASDEVKYNDMMEYYTTWVHQIKTPIASMRLTLQNEDTELTRRLIEDLFRIEQYVDMVLCYLRLDESTTDYVIKEYKLDDITRQAIRKFAGQFIRRGLKLVYEPIIQTVITDEKWLLFVIEQVLSNALKYTREGSIQIGMLEPKILFIKDSGIGIAPEDLPRVFEKGYTGYNGRADKRASGIGLYLCKRICKKLGHGITVESKEGEGTTVFIDLNQRQLKME